MVDHTVIVTLMQATENNYYTMMIVILHNRLQNLCPSKKLQMIIRNAIINMLILDFVLLVQIKILQCYSIYQGRTLLHGLGFAVDGTVDPEIHLFEPSIIQTTKFIAFVVCIK